jgi:hypothetical protein
MRVEVDHSSTHVTIRYWPSDSRSSWVVSKERDWDREGAILPATISVGARPSGWMGAETARRYADLLCQAAGLCEGLDAAIREPGDLRRITVVENEALSGVQIMSIDAKICVFIPNQGGTK